MRHLLTVVTLFAFVAAIPADDKKPEKKPDAPKADKPEKEEPKLKVGDTAPSLQADAWLQGEPIKAFAPGNVYVVEFWATWCGPCIVMMPHMSEMQAEYKSKNVTFIGFTAKDPNNSREKVEAFVSKRGPKLGYTFAYDDDRETYDAWMKAAQQRGIPCSFVVGKEGKIAYIGHPMYLDVVLPKVVDGSWSEADIKKLEGIEKEVNEVFQSFRKPDAEEVLKTLAEFESKHPALAHIPYFNQPKMMMMVKAKKIDEAKKFAGTLIAKAKKQDDPTALNAVSGALRNAGKDNKELMTIALDAAEAGLKIAGDKDVNALMGVAETHFAAGNKAKAREYGAKAVEAADNPRLKTAVENAVKKYQDDEQKEDKK